MHGSDIMRDAVICYTIKKAETKRNKLEKATNNFVASSFLFLNLPLVSRDRIREQIIHGGESRPYDTTNTHAARFMGAQKYRGLSRRTPIRCRYPLRPFINDLHFTMKERTGGLRIRIRIGDVQILRQNGCSEDLVAFSDPLCGFGQNFLLNDFKHSTKLSWGCSQRGLLGRFVNDNSFRLAGHVDTVSFSAFKWNGI
jgi:hypothetical protein